MAAIPGLVGPRAGRLAPVAEAAVVAGVVAVLALPLIGVQVPERPGARPPVVLRLDLVACCAAAGFVGRLVLWAAAALARAGYGRRKDPATTARRPAVGPAPPASHAARSKLLAGLAAFGAALAFPFLPFAGGYWIDLATTILIYVMLGWGLNIVVGLAGLLDLGYVAFYAIGAYTVGLLTTDLGWSFWACLPVAGLLAALGGVALGFPVLRLRGDYLAIVTLGFGEIIRLVLLNWQDVTGGPNGIIGIPGPSFFGAPFTPSATDGIPFHRLVGIPFDSAHRMVFLYLLILCLAVLTNVFTFRIRKLPVGRAWEALREDETACKALGINATNVKLSAFATGAMFAGFAGSFFATRQGFISPESFTFAESATILAIVVLGGMGSQFGVAAAAVLLVGLPELGRQFAEYRMLIFGAAMVAIMVWRPGGLVASRRPSFLLGPGVAPAFPEPLPAHAAVRAGDRVGDQAYAGAREPLLEVQGLKMRFGGLVAVSEISFEARAGEITAIIGPNGAGKTTVFNCLTGFYRPSAGRITVRTADAAWPLERMAGARIAAQARVARTFQNVRLFQGMTAAENLVVAQHNPLMRASGFSLTGLLGSLGYRQATAEATELARYWLRLVGLEGRANELAGQLAYGEQRRLEIARAMCTRPVLLCLDEPAAGLNPRESAELNELLATIRDRHGIGVLLIEHDMSVVMRVSDHVVVLDQGRKISDGSPAEVRRDPAVIRAYLGSDADAAVPAARPVGAAAGRTA